jgi:hypothetical protein
MRFHNRVQPYKYLRIVSILWLCYIATLPLNQLGLTPEVLHLFKFGVQIVTSLFVLGTFWLSFESAVVFGGIDMFGSTSGTAQVPVELPPQHTKVIYPTMTPTRELTAV